MLDVAQFRTLVVEPTLRRIEMHSPAAENLLVGTAIQESRITYLRQVGGGPALGLFQMEPATYDDIERYLARRTDIAARLTPLRSDWPSGADQLVGNIPYAVSLARVKFWMDPNPLPAANDIDGLGATWKRVYNTAGGAGTAEEWAENYRRYASGGS